MMIQMNVRDTQRFCETINQCNGPVEMVMANGRKEDLRNNLALQYMLTDLYPEGQPVNLTLEAPNRMDEAQLINFMMCDR